MADAERATKRKMRFVIDADGVNSIIGDLVAEGRPAAAWRVAGSCLASDGISDAERYGLAAHVVEGALRFADAGERNVPRLESTGNEPDGSIMATLESQSDRIPELESQTRSLSERLGCVYAACADDHPDALADACSRYEEEAGGVLFDVLDPEALEAFGNRFSHPVTEANPYGEPEAALALRDVAKRAAAGAMDDDYGWVSPEGDFFAVPWGEHNGFAKEMLARLDDKPCTRMNAGDELCRRGWVLLHSPTGGLAKATMADARPAKEQRDFIASYFEAHGEDAAADAIRKGWHAEMPERFDIMPDDAELKERGFEYLPYTVFGQ